MVLRNKRFTIFNCNVLLSKEDNSKTKSFTKILFSKKHSRKDERESRSTRTYAGIKLLVILVLNGSQISCEHR